MVPDVRHATTRRLYDVGVRRCNRFTARPDREYLASTGRRSAWADIRAEPGEARSGAARGSAARGGKAAISKQGVTDHIRYATWPSRARGHHHRRPLTCLRRSLWAPVSAAEPIRRPHRPRRARFVIACTRHHETAPIRAHRALNALGFDSTPARSRVSPVTVENVARGRSRSRCWGYVTAGGSSSGGNVRSSVGLSRCARQSAAHRERRPASLDLRRDAGTRGFRDRRGTTSASSRGVMPICRRSTRR